MRLWTSISPTIPLEDLSAHAAATLERLAERGYSTDQAAQTVGSGTLLVRTDEGAFNFVHQSVMEWLVANAAAAELRDRRAAYLGRPAHVAADDRLPVRPGRA